MDIPAHTIKTIFSRTTTVACDIQTTPETLWTLLTNAKEYPTWNSTVVSIDGNIALGETIQLTATLDPKRVFKLKITTYNKPTELQWGDAMGTRIYRITQQNDGIVNFSMNEKIGGPLFPLFANMIPSFDKSFDQFAADLKNAAEKIS